MANRDRYLHLYGDDAIAFINRMFIRQKAAAVFWKVTAIGGIYICGKVITYQYKEIQRLREEAKVQKKGD